MEEERDVEGAVSIDAGKGVAEGRSAAEGQSAAEDRNTAEGEGAGERAGEGAGGQGVPGMSKKAIKKAARREEQAGRRKDQRAKEKIKKKEKQEAKRLERERVHAELKEQLTPEELEARREAAREARMARGAAAKELHESLVRAARPDDPTAKLVIDFWGDVDELMTGKEMNSTGKQVLHSYSAVRRAKVNPMGMVVSGLGEAPKIEHQLRRNSGFEQWAIGRFQQGFKDVFKAGVDEGRTKLVYLTADSSRVLDKVEDGVVYVIGGLVDRNRHRNITLDRARSLGVSTARLPLDEAHLKMNGNKHLTIVAVVDAMQAKYDEPERPWSEIFVDAIAERRIQTAPGQNDEKDAGQKAPLPARKKGKLLPAEEHTPALVPTGPVSATVVRVAFPQGFRFEGAGAVPEGGPSHAEMIKRINSEALALVGSVFGEVTRAVFPDTSSDLPGDAPICGLIVYSDPGAVRKAMTDTGAAVCVQGVQGVVCAVAQGSEADLAHNKV